MAELRYRLLTWRWAFRARVHNLKMWVAWHMPKWLVYWCAYRMAANATTGEWGGEEPNKLKFFTMVDRWGHDDA